MTVVQTVQNDTHAFPCSDQSGDTNHVRNERQDAPATSSSAESDEDGGDQASCDDKDTETASKCDARSVAVANCPANEVWMGLTAEGVFNWFKGGAEGGRMSSVL